MAHSNINERRRVVAAMLAEGDPMVPATRKYIAARFGCSPNAVLADVIELSRTPGALPIYLTPSMRRRITERDQVCQYCGTSDGRFIVEHIIPAALRGPALPYNLVLACQGCNTRKRRMVWRPRNLDMITVDYPEWRERIIREATGP